jgi:hypothetical protein
MIIRAKPRKGTDYYSVVTSVRIDDKIRERTVLYIGRLDNLTEPKRIEIINPPKSGLVSYSPQR